MSMDSDLALMFNSIPIFEKLRNCNFINGCLASDCSSLGPLLYRVSILGRRS